MTTSYKLGFLTAAILAACSAEDISEKLPDKTPPAVNLEVYLTLDRPTYHPTLSVNVDDLHNNPAKEKLSSSSDYILSSEGKIKLQERKEAVTSSFLPSSDLQQVILYENGRAIITRTSTFENKLFATEFFSVDLERTDGEYTYRAKAVDNAGNSAESSSLTIVFKNGYAYPKEEMMKDKTPPKVIFFNNLNEDKLCASVYESEPTGQTGIEEVTLLTNTTVTYQYTASPRRDHDVLDIYSNANICLTNVPHGTKRHSIPELSPTTFPTPETLAAVKDVVVVAKDFAGNEARIAYSLTDDFKELEGDIKDWEKLNSGSMSKEDLLKMLKE